MSKHKKPTSKPNPPKTALTSPLARIRTVEVKGVGGKVKNIEKCGGYVI